LRKVIAFQIFILVSIVIIWAQGPLGNFPLWLKEFELAVNCILIAMLGGTLYCLRAVYLNRCVKNTWSENWEVWYYIRPLTSALSGLIAYIFLKAGLIILEADQGIEAGNYGFLAVSLVAGLNVDKFVQKIEDIAKTAFGIEKSRSSTESDKE